MTGFGYWEAEVNRIMESTYGVGIDDIPDMPYHDWFDDGWDTSDAVAEVNRIMESTHGVGIDDIPDMPYHDWFDDG